jgi:hypothetical protein
MKDLKDLLINEDCDGKCLNDQNLLAIMCMIETMQNDGNYSSSLQANKIKPTMPEEEIAKLANVLINQDIWKIV